MATSVIKGMKTESPNASDFIAPESGWTCSIREVVSVGNIVMMRFIANYNGTWNNGIQNFIGTLKPKYRPHIACPLVSVATTGIITPEGQCYARNVSGGSLSNADTTYTAIFIK